MRLVSCVALFVFVTALALGSATTGDPEDAKVREVVGLYFKGAATAEASYFESCFDVDTAHMKHVRKGDDGKEVVRAVPIADAIKSWTRSEPEPSWGKILDVSVIDGKLATATVELLYRQTIYVDVLSLYKVNGVWKIVNKVFVSRGRAGA